jgi:putative membrane protein
MASAIVSALHVLALALGLSSVYLRGRALKGRLDREGLQRLFAADNVWGIAAGLWIVTGLLRAFGGLEKGSQFYLQSPLFWIKMALFVAVIVLEIRPMITFIRWRRTSVAERFRIRQERAPSISSTTSRWPWWWSSSSWPASWPAASG